MGTVSRDGGGERGERRAPVVVIVPGVEGWVEGGALHLGDICARKRKKNSMHSLLMRAVNHHPNHHHGGADC